MQHIILLKLIVFGVFAKIAYRPQYGNFHTVDKLENVFQEYFLKHRQNSVDGTHVY